MLLRHHFSWIKIDIARDAPDALRLEETPRNTSVQDSLVSREFSCLLETYFIRQSENEIRQISEKARQVSQFGARRGEIVPIVVTSGRRLMIYRYANSRTPSST